MTKQSKEDTEVSNVKIDSFASKRRWTAMTTAKIALVPLLIILLVTAYLAIMPKQWLAQGGIGDDIPLSDVELIAGTIGALSEHHRLTVDNAGKNSNANAWMSLQKKSKKDAVIKYSERLTQLDISGKENSWSKAVKLVNDYISSHVDTSDKVALDLEDSSVTKMTKQFTKVHSSLVGLLKAPGVDSSEAVSEDDSPSSTAGVVNPYTTYLTVTMALMALIALSVLLTSFLMVRSFYKRLGGTPEHLQSVADALSINDSKFKSNNFGSDYSGLLATLQEIGVKLEGHRAGKRLAKQINGRLGHSEHNVISQDSDIAMSDNSLEIETDTNTTKSNVQSLSVIPDKASNNNSSEVNTELLDELNALRALHEDNESRISALLITSKCISEGDLTQTSGVSGEDSIGQIALFQERNVSALKNRLTIFADQSSSLKDSSQSLIDINDHMIHSSVKTAEQAELVSSSAEEISQNVDSVALAVKEMSASIREISEHTAEAAQVAEHAVVLASDTDATVRKLSESSTAIDAVIKVINSIAEQTNLLALNATIEAARAGDAGKGFAVVANEVKELAKETARATEEIAQQIATIQSDSHDAVTVIGDISKIIDRVNEIQSTIAAAVEEQSVTTAEINRSINDVSHGSSQIAKNVSDVAETAKESKGSVEKAKETVENIINVSNDLDEMLSGYRLSNGKKRRKAA